MPKTRAIYDANEVVAKVAHRLSEVIAIYPITPASGMGELADDWSAAGKTNLWGAVPRVVEMQSEAGAAGAVHGAISAGSLATSFTASQGLLLMLPDLYKIAGELSPFVLHVAARTIATHALSIFGDHSDVMSARSTGAVLLCSGSVQEAHDFAAVAHAATLRSRLPFLHFFDGFRTSHELATLTLLDDEDLRALLDEAAIRAFRGRAMSPDHPTIRGTAQNPDTWFQAREGANAYYDACPRIVSETFDLLAERTGRRYHLFDYEGHPEAERVIVAMGSAVGTIGETVARMVREGEKVGVVAVRLYRPFDAAALLRAIPRTARVLGVLDRTKEPGAPGEPLWLDVQAAVARAAVTQTSPFAAPPIVVGGRYGLSSKEFTPGMARAVYRELGQDRPRHGFTVGIVDDVTRLSLPWEETDREDGDVVRAVFFGLGSDGTVSTNKESIKILGASGERYAQAYFVYDSKKSGSTTVSHLRFGPRPIRSAYLVREASFVACHDPALLDARDVLEVAAPGATVLLNTAVEPAQVFASLPREAQDKIVDRKLRVFCIDALAVARDVGLGRRVGTVLQACFFALADVLPRDEALARIKEAATRAYGKRGPDVVRRNHEAIDAAVSRIREVPVPARASTERRLREPVPAGAPDFVRRVTAMLLAGHGDALPVSAFPADGTWPTATAKHEKRAIAPEIPVWDPKICIQCNKCVLVCPHASIRATVVAPTALAGAPEGFTTTPFKGRDLGEAAPGTPWQYRLQVAPDDCTGCGLCVQFCPAKDKANPRHKAIDMAPIGPVQAQERATWSFFERLPEPPRERVPRDLKSAQFLTPLFEFSGACSGCGETPYLSLLTRLSGDRMIVANATGCSSIYGGNLPTTPWTKDAAGRGPAWANSLFEDNAEFGLGMRLAIDAQRDLAQGLARALAPELGEVLVDALLDARQDDEAGVEAQRARVKLLREKLTELGGHDAARLEAVADALVRRDVWIVGGDGWAYDIGFGGLDHVLATGANVNVLVLDTEVYSNTGGQQSKATPIGAVAKFAAAGKSVGKKDLGLLAMTYGHVYVASIAMGAKDAHAVKVMQEAESWPGPSLVIAYSHCIAHGYDLRHGLEQQKLAVSSGVWPLYRFDPRRIEAGESPLSLDAPPPTTSVRDYMKNEGRFRMVELADPVRHERLAKLATEFAARRRALYEQLASVQLPKPDAPRGAPPKGEERA